MSKVNWTLTDKWLLKDAEVLGSISRGIYVFFLIEKIFFLSCHECYFISLTLTDFRNIGWEISEKLSESNYLNFSCI